MTIDRNGEVAYFAGVSIALSPVVTSNTGIIKVVEVSHMLIRSIIGMEHSLAGVTFNLSIPVFECVHVLVARQDIGEWKMAGVTVNPVIAVGHMCVEVIPLMKQVSTSRALVHLSGKRIHERVRMKDGSVAKEGMRQKKRSQVRVQP